MVLIAEVTHFFDRYLQYLPKLADLLITELYHFAFRLSAALLDEGIGDTLERIR